LQRIGEQGQERPWSASGGRARREGGAGCVEAVEEREEVVNESGVAEVLRGDKPRQ
jgi:hypothetical protein